MNIKKTQQGFTLIELMIVIAIVGILAAIALPAYQDYTIRSRMAELTAVGAEAKTSIAEYVSSQGRFPSEVSSGVITKGNGNYVKEVDIVGGNTTGSISIQASSANELGDAASKFLFFTGTLDASTRRVLWVCGGTGTTVDAKYLPSSCRG